MEIRCAACGASFECNPGPACWCAQLPRLPIPDKAAGCSCPDCLAARLAERDAKSPKI